MNRNPYQEIANALRAGRTIWQVIPLLVKLPDGFIVDSPDGDFAYSTHIEFQHPHDVGKPTCVFYDRPFIEIMRKDDCDLLSTEYREAIVRLIWALEQWAKEPITQSNTPPSSVPEFRNKEKIALANWTDEHRNMNPKITDENLATAYYQHLRTTDRNKTSKYSKQPKETAIIAITRTIREIRQGRNKKSSNEKS